MTDISSVKKFVISAFCAFAFILYIPTACVISNSLHGNNSYADSACCAEEETTDCAESYEDMCK